MSVSVKRRDEGSLAISPNGSVRAYEIEWLVMDARNRDEACEAVRVASPTKHGKIPLTEIRFVGWSGERIAEVVSVYEKKQKTTTAEYLGYDTRSKAVAAFDCSNATFHAVNALRQECRFSTTGIPIGVQCTHIPIGSTLKHDDEPAGLDILYPQVTEKYVKVLPFDKVTSTAWKRKMSRFNRCLNSGTFKGWSPGEVLFMGCNYSTPVSGVDDVVVEFNFSIAENEDNAVVGGHAIGMVLGHDYIWTMQTDVNGVTTVANVFVSGVYAFRDFSELGV